MLEPTECKLETAVNAYIRANPEEHKKALEYGEQLDPYINLMDPRGPNYDPATIVLYNDYVVLKKCIEQYGLTDGDLSERDKMLLDKFDKK